MCIHKTVVRGEVDKNGLPLRIPVNRYRQVNPLDLMGICLNKQKLMNNYNAQYYNPSINSYGDSGHMYNNYVSVDYEQRCRGSFLHLPFKSYISSAVCAHSLTSHLLLHCNEVQTPAHCACAVSLIDGLDYHYAFTRGLHASIARGRV